MYDAMPDTTPTRQGDTRRAPSVAVTASPSKRPDVEGAQRTPGFKRLAERENITYVNATIRNEPMSVTALRIVPLGRIPRVRARSTARTLVVAVTVGRIAIAAWILVAWVWKLPIISVLALAVFVLVDVLDGVIARAMYVETAARRALDGVIDKLSIHLVAVIVCLATPQDLWIWGVIAARDVLQGAIGAWVILRVRVIAAGAPWHGAYTSAIALWGAALILSLPAVPLGIVAAALGLATLADYARLCCALRSPRSIHGGPE
jgi:phosphatidylglycerophosphate synthase